jgi:hypothetical protein
MRALAKVGSATEGSKWLRMNWSVARCRRDDVLLDRRPGRRVARGDHEERERRDRGHRRGRRQQPRGERTARGLVLGVERLEDAGAQQIGRGRRRQLAADAADGRTLALAVLAARSALGEVQLDVTQLVAGQLAVVERHRQGLDAVAELLHGGTCWVIGDQERGFAFLR